MKPKFRNVALASVTLVALGSAFVGIRYIYLPMRALSKALELRNRGFTNLAEEKLDCYRRDFVGTEEGCRALLHVYHFNRNKTRLHWASEACLNGGVRIPEAFLSLALSYEDLGKDEQAVQLLGQAAIQYPNVPAIQIEMAKIYLRNRAPKEAERALIKAAKEAESEPKILLEVVRLLIDADSRDRAASYAEKLLANPELEEPVKAEAKALAAAARRPKPAAK